MAKEPIKCKVKILSPLPEVFPAYQPIVGQVYDASYHSASRKGTSTASEVCLINVKDKKIALRKGEYEIVEDA